MSSTSERAARLRASALCAADVTLFALVFGLGVSKSPMANLLRVRVRVRVRVRLRVRVRVRVSVRIRVS